MNVFRKLLFFFNLNTFEYPKSEVGWSRPSALTVQAVHIFELKNISYYPHFILFFYRFSCYLFKLCFKSKRLLSCLKHENQEADHAGTARRVDIVVVQVAFRENCQ